MRLRVPGTKHAADSVARPEVPPTLVFPLSFLSFFSSSSLFCSVRLPSILPTPCHLRPSSHRLTSCCCTWLWLSYPGLSKKDVAVSTAVVSCVATFLVGVVTNKVRVLLGPCIKTVPIHCRATFNLLLVSRQYVHSPAAVHPPLLARARSLPRSCARSPSLLCCASALALSRSPLSLFPMLRRSHVPVAVLRGASDGYKRICRTDCVGRRQEA